MIYQIYGGPFTCMHQTFNTAFKKQKKRGFAYLFIKKSLKKSFDKLQILSWPALLF